MAAQPQPSAPKFALVAGEASGDALGAGLIKALRARYPQAQFAGIGGDAMRAAGLDAWHDSQELAVMGLAEVISHLPRLLRLRSRLRRRVLNWQPDVFIGIDAPDFNLGVERWLKTRGVRTVHYVSPSVWAWRENRAAKLGDSADCVLCLFPMEPPIYARHGVDARFVGHPLADAIPLQPDRMSARRHLHIEDGTPVLALLPGSRLGEIASMLPIFLDALALVVQSIPRMQALLPAANDACTAAIRAQLQARPELSARVRVLDGQAQTAMIASDAVLLASGTAALEGMFCKRPMVVGHRIAASTYRFVKTFNLLKSQYVSLPNVLAEHLRSGSAPADWPSPDNVSMLSAHIGTTNDSPLVPELLQHDCTPEKLAAALLRWLGQPAAVAALQPRYLAIHQQLRLDASERAADAVAELLIQTPHA